MKILLLTLVSALFLNVSYSQLTYTYYEGNWNNLPDFGNVTPLKSGSASNVDIAVRNRDYNYSILWTGNIYIATEGSYIFETNSDDGSRFIVSNNSNGQSAVVANDGLHGAQTKASSIYLKPGTYPVAIAYFQQGGLQSMEVYYSSNTGIARQRIPDAAFSSGSSNGGSTGGNTGATTGGNTGSAVSNGGLNYFYYEGNFSQLPDYNNTLQSTKTGKASNFNLGVRNRDTYYSILWMGNITLPADGLYTFETKSDDGSRFVLADKTTGRNLMVNNDGLHGDQIVTDRMQLKAGTYEIAVSYFQAAGGQTMEVYWSSNTGISRQQIPDNAFTGGSSTPVTPVTPDPVPDPTPAKPSEPTVLPPVEPSYPSTPSNPSESGGLTGSANYYFSSTSGDDNRSASQAQNASTPWRSIAKANSVMGSLPNGAALLFKRGEVFDGSLAVIKSGVIISAYGTGTKPVVNGFTNLSNWTQVGSGLWEAPCNGQNLVNMVTVNGNLQVMGRWPNITDANKGFLKFEAHSGNSVIYDYNIPMVADWRGGDLVIRKNRWTLDRCYITGYSSNGFSFNSPSDMPPIDGFGYFVQNHPGTLDQFGEWYYNPNTKRLRMYFGNYSPNSVDVKASVVSRLLTIRGVSNVVVDNISFQGSNDLGVEVSSGANNVDIKNCVVGFSGVNAVMAYFVNGFIFENSTITNTNNNAMYLAPFCNSAIVRNNTVSNTGLYAGMGASNNDAIQGIIIQGSNNQILNNFVENTGSNGIKFLGENVLIKNNFVNNFCLTTDDAGGIYSSGENNRYGRQVVGNIIMNGRGAPEGSDQENYIPANGIYLDDKTTNVDVLNNTIANVSENGIFVHNSHEINIQGNTIYNTGRASITMNSDVLEPNDPVRNVQLYNNIFVAKHASQLTNWMVSTRDDFYAYGNFDNNAYCRPLNDNNYISTYITDNRWISRFFSVNTWRQNLGKDGYSTKSPVTIPSNANPDDYMRLEYNASTTPRSVSLDGNYIDAKYNRYSGTVSIPAYSSLMLFKITSGTTLQSTPSVTTASTDAAAMDVAANTSEKLSVNVLPNPATNRVQIAINAPAGTKKASVTIYSIAGVAVKTIPVTLNTQNIAVDISDWKGGTYIISLKYDDKAITKQFVKL